MIPSKQVVNEADLLDVVRRLRQHINNLDNANLLVGLLKQFHDPNLTNMSERIAVDIDNVAASTANLLKHVENSSQYRAIVKKYRAPHAEEEDNETEDHSFA